LALSRWASGTVGSELKLSYPPKVAPDPAFRDFAFLIGMTFLRGAVMLAGDPSGDA